MRVVQMIVGVLGRAFLSLIFILSAMNKMMNWQQCEQNIINSLCDLLNYSQGTDWVQMMAQALLPWASLLVFLAIAFQLLGGLLVFFGFKVRFGALLLILFLIPATFLFHHFWWLQGAERELQLAMFFKNLSIFGGLLILLAFGAGGSSSKKEEPVDA